MKNLAETGVLGYSSCLGFDAKVIPHTGSRFRVFKIHVLMFGKFGILSLLHDIILSMCTTDIRGKKSSPPSRVRKYSKEAGLKTSKVEHFKENCLNVPFWGLRPLFLYKKKEYKLETTFPSLFQRCNSRQITSNFEHEVIYYIYCYE